MRKITQSAPIAHQTQTAAWKKDVSVLRDSSEKITISVCLKISVIQSLQRFPPHMSVDRMKSGKIVRVAQVLKLF